MATYKIAVLPGDGIGQEVTPQAQRVLQVVAKATGIGFEFETDADDDVRCYWKEGVNVGVSGMLCHYPTKDITFAVLAVGAKAAWDPIKAIHEAVANI